MHRRRVDIHGFSDVLVSPDISSIGSAHETSRVHNTLGWSCRRFDEGQAEGAVDLGAAEEQMRQHYVDAFEARDRSAAMKIDRRRDYKKARDLEARRLLGNVGTCIPHADGSQPQTATPQQPAPPQTSQPTPSPGPRT